MTLDTPFLVGLAGGSGSGKSALAGALADALGADRVALVPHDAYYRDRSNLPPEARAGLDYDAPDALDDGLFLQHLHALRAGRPVCPPRYCFVTHRRLGGAAPIEPRDVVIAEGILLLHDPAVRGVLDLSIYVDAPERVRLARRIARDTRERGRTEASVRAQFEATVRPAHAAYVEPTRDLADLVLLNVGRIEALAEVAATVIRHHLARRGAAPAARP